MMRHLPLGGCSSGSTMSLVTSFASVAVITSGWKMATACPAAERTTGTACCRQCMRARLARFRVTHFGSTSDAAGCIHGCRKRNRSRCPWRRNAII